MNLGASPSLISPAGQDSQIAWARPSRDARYVSAAMTTNIFSDVINSLWGMYMVSDPWVQRLPPDLDAGDPWGINGLIGLTTPSAGTIVTGTKYGPVRLTVEVHDERVSASGIGNVWSEIVEVCFEIRSGQFLVSDWNGEPIHRLQDLPLGTYRLRVHARGRDEGAARQWDPLLTEEPVEEHLLQLWLGPDLGDTVILTSDQYGRGLRGEPPAAR